jgi:hypothetical protein
MSRWQEIVENGLHEFRGDFDGVTLIISKLNIADAWACCLAEGKRVVGELQDVKRTVEIMMDCRD